MKVLIADDEPHFLEWIEDYLEPKSIDVDYAVTVEEAVDKLTKNIYRFILVDLNIPLTDAFSGDIASSEAWFQKFPGLYTAYMARNNGYRSKQVIIYSVHLEESVSAYIDQIRATHIPKGWPQDLKSEIERILSYDPSEFA